MIYLVLFNTGTKNHFDFKSNEVELDCLGEINWRLKQNPILLKDIYKIVLALDN